MIVRLRLLLLFSLLAPAMASSAQDMDYLRHNKVFYLCSFRRECSDCFSCEHGRYLVRLENRVDKRISKISYKYYSAVNNRIVERTAKIEGDVIDGKHIGRLYICVPEGDHWIISKITYDDDSQTTFTLRDRMDNFIQEPDECDCNP